jgi:hypothetical protein
MERTRASSDPEAHVIGFVVGALAIVWFACLAALIRYVAPRFY